MNKRATEIDTIAKKFVLHHFVDLEVKCENGLSDLHFEERPGTTYCIIHNILKNSCEAIKEAVMKAMGTGMAGAAFAEIVVRHHDSGQPFVELVGETAARAAALGIESWSLTITHSRSTAAAVAIAERR